MAEKYKENLLFKPVEKVAFAVKQASLAAKRARKSFPVGKYTGLMDNVQGTYKSTLGDLGTVTTPYGGSTRYEKVHPGIDIANKIGTIIPSFLGGKVTAVETGRRQGERGYGNYVIITDQYGGKHRYSHLSQSYVKVGQDVQTGAPIGAMGATGQTYSLTGGTGSHLDYRILDAYNRYINPVAYISKYKNII